MQTAVELRFLSLSGLDAVSIALQHHLTGVLRCRHVGAKATRLARSFGRHLRAENKSDRTVEAFFANLLARWKPATAANRYRSLKVFSAWLEDEGEIAADPMAKMKPPAIPEQPIPIVPDEALRRLFAVCAGKGFEARRDTAMIMLLLESGARRAELVGLRVEDLDFEAECA